MKVEMRMPQMGESIAEATILKWLKEEGDTVDKDETLLEISTDKVDSEIPSPASGVIAEIKAQEGDTVEVKSVIAIIETDADAAASSDEEASKKEKSEEKQAESQEAKEDEPKEEAPKQPVEEEQQEKQPEAPSPQASQQQPSQPAPARTEQGAGSSVPAQIGDRFYSPLVRSLAAQYGVRADELNQIQGTGAQGRVTKADLMTYIDLRRSSDATVPGAAAEASGMAAQAPAGPPATRGASTAAPPAKQTTPSGHFDASGVRAEPLDKMRKLIADHMVRSKQTSPHVYTMTEVDVTNIAKWRKAHQNEFVNREGFKLSFTPFFLEAAVKALIQHPTVNASLDGDTLMVKRDVNLGVAVALGTTGLIVPVIKNASALSLAGIARALNDVATRARDKQLNPDDIQGGTFTVTNSGVFGSSMGCPIINQPQLAILSVGAIKKRPVVINDSIAIRDIVYLTLAYDHRIIDGALGGRFLQTIQQYLESWDMNRGVF